MTQRLNDLASLGGMLHPLLPLSHGVRHIYLIDRLQMGVTETEHLSR